MLTLFYTAYRKVLIIIEIDIITPGAKVGDRIGTPSPYKPGDKKPAEAGINSN